MSRLYGDAIQAAYLVDALEPAIVSRTRTLGIGPFFIMPTPQFAWLRHGGQEAQHIDIIGQVALAHCGNMQIERFDQQREAAIATGMSIVTEGACQRTRFAYLQPPPDAPGPIVELIDRVPVITEI